MWSPATGSYAALLTRAGPGAGPATYWQRGKNWAPVIPSDYVSPIVVLVALINTVSMGIRTAADTSQD